jgi:tetratricopeptide (TPR) repeat protein
MHWLKLWSRGLVAVVLLGQLSACGGGSENVTSTFEAGADEDAYEAGIAAQRAGNLRRALAYFDEAIAHNPRYLAAHLARGDVQLELGRYDDALSTFDQAVAIRDASGEAHLGRAEALLGLGRFEESVEAAAAARERGLEAEAAYVEAGGLAANGDIDGAIDLLEMALRENPASDEVRFSLADLYVRAGRPSEAVPLLERAARRDLEDIDIWQRLAELLHSLEQWDRAVEAWQRVARLTPNDPTPLVKIGEAELFIGNHMLAIQALDDALAIDPTRVDAYVLRGRAELTRGFPERARNNAEAALDLDPGNIEAMNLLAGTFEGAGDIEEAIDAYRVAVEGDPENLDTVVALARLVLSRGRIEETLEILGPYADRETENANIARLFSIAYREMGDSDAALTHLVSYIEVNPRDPSVMLEVVETALASPGQTLLTDEEVLEFARQAMQLSGGFLLEYRLALIDALANNGMREEALEEVRRGLEDIPNNSDLLERLRRLR